MYSEGRNDELEKMVREEIKKFINEEIKPLCEKYGIEYLRSSGHFELTSIEVRLKDDVTFWVEGHLKQIRFVSEPWKIKVEDLVRMTTFTHKASNLLNSFYKEHKQL